MKLPQNKFNTHVEAHFTADFILNTIYADVKHKKNNRGQCPFPGHTGKTKDNFVINTETTQFKCHGACGKSGNYIDYLKELKGIQQPVEWCAERLGVSREDVKSSSLPASTIDAKSVLESHKALMESDHQAKSDLLTLGLSEDILKTHLIGLDKGYYVIPYMDSTEMSYVGLVYYHPTKQPKVRTSKGFSGKHLFPYSSLNDTLIYIFEGEKDTLLALSLGLNAITNKGGVNNWDNSWGKNFFKGKDVVLCMDVDEAGQSGAKQRITSLQPHTNTLKKIDLPLDKEKYPHGDFHDYIQAEKHTIDDFLKLVADTSIVTKEEVATEDSKKVSAEKVAKLIVKNHPFANFEKEGMYCYDPKQGIYIKKPEIYSKKLIVETFSMLGGHATKNQVVETAFQLEIEALVAEGISLNGNKDMLILENTAYDVQIDKQIPHHKEQYASIKTSYPFNPRANCSVWQKCIEDWSNNDETWGLVMQELFGICLAPIDYGDAFPAFFFYGRGSDGKSKLCSMLKLLVGSDNVGSVPPHKFGSPNSIIRLKGKLINICTEISDELLKTDIFKAVTDSEKVEGKTLYKDLEEIQIDCRHVFACNTLPRMKDRTLGNKRRIVVVPFERQFLGKSRDRDLEKKLISELPGILNWAIKGRKRFFKNDMTFTRCERIEQAREDYFKESNPLQLFLDDHCELGDGFWVSRSRFREQYVDYCKTMGYQALSSVQVGKELKNLGLDPNGSGWMQSRQVNGTRTHTRGYPNIRLKNDPQDESLNLEVPD